MVPMIQDTVRVDRIDSTADAYRITTQRAGDDLMRSIQAVGLLTLPIIARRAHNYQVVSGFRRIAACRKLAIPQMPVRVLSPETTPLDWAKVAITENFHQRALNLIELARTYSLLFEHTVRPSEASRIAGRLDLPANLDYMEKVGNVCRMAPCIQNAILSGTVTLPMAIDLNTLPATAYESMVRLFQDLKLGLNRQRETLRMFQDISKRDGASLPDLINAVMSRLTEGDEMGGSSEKARWLRHHLRRRRYPNIIRTEEEFNRLVASLRLGEGIKLIPPKHFEGTTYTFEVEFDSPGRMRQRITHLQEVSDHPGLSGILKREL